MHGVLAAQTIELAFVKKWKAVKVKRKLRNPWVLTAVVASLVVLAYVWEQKALASAEMASWVQAIGALLAIAIAIHLARASAEREEAIRAAASAEAAESSLQDRKAQVKAVCLIADSVCDSLISGYKVLEDRLQSRDFGRALPVFAVKRGADAISRVPAHEIPYTIVGRQLMTLAIFADNYLQLARDMRRAGRQGKVALGDDALRRIRRSRSAVKNVKERFECLRTTYDGRAALPITVDDL